MQPPTDASCLQVRSAVHLWATAMLAGAGPAALWTFRSTQGVMCSQCSALPFLCVKDSMTCGQIDMYDCH
jgi:hypothetical protein